MAVEVVVLWIVAPPLMEVDELEIWESATRSRERERRKEGLVVKFGTGFVVWDLGSLICGQ